MKWGRPFDPDAQAIGVAAKGHLVNMLEQASALAVIERASQQQKVGAVNIRRG